MSRYAVYSPSTGRILRFVECPPALAELQVAAGEALLPDWQGNIRDDTHRVYGWTFVELPSPPPPSEEQIREAFIGFAQAHLDTAAQAWGYDDIRSAVSYVGDPYPRFAAEGLALRNWRSEVWAYLDAAGAQPLPDPVPTLEEFVAMLPPIPTRPS